MLSLDRLPAFAYKALIVVATAIWGVSFVVMKDAVDVISPAWLLGIRFTLAGVILCAILWRRVAADHRLRTIGAGMLLGVFDFTAFYAQTVGLQYTTPGINAFLTATYCVIVPFVWWVVGRRRPTVFNIAAALLAVAGIWLVSGGSLGEGLTLGYGESLTLLCAVAFAVHIVFVSKFSQFSDALVLTVFQFLTEGLCALAVGACIEPPPTAAILLSSDIMLQLGFLILFAAIFAFGVQNLALAHVSPVQASLLLSLESVFGVVFSVLLYGEQVTAQLLAGFALIFVAIVMSETLPLKKAPVVQPAAAVPDRGARGEGASGQPVDVPGATGSR